MRRRSLLPLICHATAAALLGCAFLVVSAPKVWMAFRTKRFGPMLPYHTTNSYMVSLLGVQNGSEQIVRAFSALPRDKPAAVVVVRGDEESIFLGYLVSYFAWPREVRTIEVTSNTVADRLKSFDRTAVSAIIFCGTNALPEMTPVLPIGSRLLMVPTLSNSDVTGP